MANDGKPIVWARNRGRDGWDHQIRVGPDRSVESLNVHLYEGGLGTKRGGITAITTTGVTGPINAMTEYIPAQDQTASELFVVDSSATTKILRCAGGASFSNLTLKDNVASAPQRVSFAVLNGKLYIAYDSTVNRLHKFDPAYSTTDVIRAGMGTAAAATVADGGGGGAYAATLRYYRVAYAEYVGGVRKRLGLLGPSVSFTPSGVNANATITKPAAISEGETHWELYGSADDELYYLLSVGGVGTATIADTIDPVNYAARDAAPAEGANTPFPSVKALATDGTRLLGFGAWESSAGDSLAPKAGRVYFGPALDASAGTLYAVDDDERINNTTTLQGYIDLARNSSAEDRGITPRPVNDVFYAFQSNGTYAIIPTDSPIKPFRREVVDPIIGSLSQHAIVNGSDRFGRPCCYFLDPVKGPMTIGGVDGMRWCGKDLADQWATVNKDATTLTAWGLWYPDREQVWFSVAQGANNQPSITFVLDVTELQPDEDGDLRGGWTVYTDAISGGWRCGTLFANTLASPRPRTRVPHVADGSGANRGLGRYDESVFTDWGSTFNSSVLSGAIVYGVESIGVLRSYLFGAGSTTVSTLITQSLIRNGGDEALPRTSQVNMNMTGLNNATLLMKKFEDSAIQDTWCLQVKLADSDVGPWTLHEWRGEITKGAHF